MKEYGKSQYLRERVGIFVATVLLSAVAAAVLGGCASADMTFTVRQINLVVGETRDIKPYVVFTPNSVKDKTVSLYSDADCVKIRGTEVTAVSSGTAVVIAEAFGIKREVEVLCTYRDATWLGISCDNGKLVQTLSDGHGDTVRLNATTGENVDPSNTIEWFVNGKFAGIGKSFAYTPSARGEYEIRARIALGGEVKAEDAVTVKAYERTAAHGTVRGELRQTRDFSPVLFCACEDTDYTNPPSAYEWRVNGAIAGNGRTFKFTPSASGEYDITLKVNGLDREIDGAYKATVSATGLRAPSGKVEFDDKDGVFVSWRDGEYVKSVSVTDPDGNRRVYSAGELTQAGLFSRGTFDATDVIDVCSARPGKYVLRLTGDVAGAEFEFSQYPETAAQYISRKVYTKNAFLSSADDCADYLTELYLTGARTGDAYLARELSKEIAQTAVVERAEQLSLDASVSVDDGILTVSLSEYCNAPTSVDIVNAAQSYSLPPHVEYDSAARRSNKYVLSCERNAEISVDSTEQLWYAVTRGFKPKITDAAVQTVYTRTRTVLLNIIGKDYSDAQKVHAIYDWVQWTAPRVTAADANSSARFIDAVFVGAQGGKAGVTREGAAKTVALLCGMEGIKCDVVFGDGCKNLVTVDGEKYYIDIFAGKLEASATRVLTAHAGLLVPVDEFTKPITYCVQKHIYNGVYFDYYVDKSECLDKDTVNAAIFYAFGGQNYRELTIRDATSKVIVSAVEYGAEFVLSPLLTQEDVDAFTANLTDAVKAFGQSVGVEYDDGDVRIRQIGNIVTVGSVKPTKETVQ